jgi:hypothetical protein
MAQQESDMSDASTYPSMNPIIGRWRYRSFVPTAKDVSFGDLEFGDGVLRFAPAPMQSIAGHIGGTTWDLILQGSMTYGNPFTLRFEGKGLVNGEMWIYDYEGYLIRPWPNAVGQLPAIVGSVIRTIPHSDGSGGIAPAGYVAPFTAMWIDGNYNAA